MNEQCDSIGTVTLFVYGTLKKGFWNHEAYCGNAVSIQNATVRGRLYELPSAIPVLLVPEEDILAVGSCCVRDDVIGQGRNTLPSISSSRDGWDDVQGELIILADLSSVEEIDRLEGFRPGQISLYRRVMIPVTTPSVPAQLAWCYVLGVAPSRSIIPLGRNSWP